MASELESIESDPNTETKTGPPVLSECRGSVCAGDSERDLDDSTAPHLSPVNTIEVVGEEVASDVIVYDEASGQKRHPEHVTRLRSTSVKRKRAHLRRRSGGEGDCNSASSGSVSRRTRKSERNPVLITLSSDSGSDSEAKDKMSSSENEDTKPEVSHLPEVTGKKRLAHINAELIRKFSALRWNRKRPERKLSDSSSSNSGTKEKKNMGNNRKRKNLTSRAAMAKKKYFRTNTRNKILSVSPLKRNIKGRPARLRNMRCRRATYPVLPKLRGRPPLHLEAVHSVMVSKRGRPRKYFQKIPSSNLSATNRVPCDLPCKSGSVDDDSTADAQLQRNKSHCIMGDMVRRVSIDREPPAEGTVAPVVRKRGRPRLSDKERELRMKNKKHLKIDRKIRPVLQNESCFELAAKLPKCRECRLASKNRGRKNQHSYCRFFEYRKLCFAKNGTVLNAGFSEASDSTIEDLRMWLPTPDSPPGDLTIETSKALLVQVGDQFCDLIMQEKEALTLHIGTDKTVTWKRIVQGVREMCDVCDTTLFNIHWVCPKCGLAVCIDCYKVRKQGAPIENDENRMKGQDEFLWLLCNGRQPHEPDKLIMAQIVPGNALWTMRDVMHRARELWKIEAHCRCMPQEIANKAKKSVPTGICKPLMSQLFKSFTLTPIYSDPNARAYVEEQSNCPKVDVEIDGSAMKWLEDVDDGTDLFPEDGSCFEDFTFLKKMLGKDDINYEPPPPPTFYSSFTMDDLLEGVKESSAELARRKGGKENTNIFNERYPQPNSGRDPLPIQIFTTSESSMRYSDVPHSWLCNGRLLLLHQPNHPKNLELFQQQWKRGQPIMVKGVDQHLDMTLWHPDGFSRDFGEVKNDLVNCRTGAVIRNLPMKKFWEGFENFEKRMKDESGEYMLLKLKDWPPGEDFSEKLPKRFHDLMKGLPLPEYTHRDGIFNLAGRLPHWFVRPDLGPKMYNAYGSALYPTKGTTNLHLDVSDAVNVMVYVGVPHDGKDEDHIQEALKAIDEGGCDSLMKERVRSRGVRPGALWHIYNARDADKIREMLTKVAIERGEKLEAQHDPIHDQSWYIDTELRKRLYQEYGVEGYAIAQCLGDAVFIPAGAPHQVRNLHSCVKVAEDFVSPENIAHCFKLTQEFRHLSDTHTNHEDKLQIKNIIYHVVKDALSHLIDQEAARMYHLTDL